MATYYVDYENGYDKPINQYAFATNVPGSTAVLITYGITDHGLTTGDQVVLSQFTAYLNVTWTITVIDSRSFTLDGATWATTSDPNGVCTPVVTSGGNDGSSWGNAIKQLGSATNKAGLYNISLQPGDIVKIAKTPDPVSIGNATWADRTRTIELSAPLTQLIESCIGNTWTAVSPSTLSASSTRKKGSNCQLINVNTAASGKIAYKALASTLDLSTFQNISLFFGGNNIINFRASKFRICLCSDTTGDVVVEQFYLNDILTTTSLNVQTYKKGSALGNSIKSIALYRDYTTAATSVMLNVIIACNTLALDSLIGKSNSINSLWYPIKYIDGTTVELDSATAADYTGYYYGLSETIETYVRETLKISQYTNSGVLYFISENLSSQGGYGNEIQISGGWNPATGEQDGETWFDATQNFNIYGLHHSTVSSYFKWSKLNFVRFSFGFSSNETLSNSNKWEIQFISCVCNLKGGLLAMGTIAKNVNFLHNRTLGLQLNNYNDLQDFVISGNGGVNYNNNAGLYVKQNNNHIESGVIMWNGQSLLIDGVNNILRDFIFSQYAYEIVRYGSNNKFLNIDSYNEFTGALGITVMASGINEFINCRIGADDGSIPVGNSQGVSITKFTNHWQHNGLTGISWGLPRLDFQPELSFGSTQGIWKLSIPNGTIDNNKRLGIYCPIAPIAVKAGVSTTVGLWIKRSSNSNGSALICRRDMSTAIDADIISPLPLANNTWVLAGLNIVADRDGVVLIELHGFEDSNTAIYFSTLVI